MSAKLSVPSEHAFSAMEQTCFSGPSPGPRYNKHHTSNPTAECLAASRGGCGAWCLLRGWRRVSRRIRSGPRLPQRHQAPVSHLHSALGDVWRDRGGTDRPWIVSALTPSSTVQNGDRILLRLF